MVKHPHDTSNSFLNSDEVKQIGFKQVGKNVLISRFARFYSSENMTLGDNVRIDDFSIISGKLNIGSYVHISAHCLLYGSYGIKLEDYTGVSPRCTIFSATDDFSGFFMIGPMLPAEFTNVLTGEVVLKKYSQLGAGSIVLPSTTIEEGAATGAMTLVTKNLDPWFIYAGIPAKKIKPRSKNILDLVIQYESRFL